MDIAWCTDGSPTANRALRDAPRLLRDEDRSDHVLVVVPPLQSTGMSLTFGSPYLPEATLLEAAEEEGRQQLVEGIGVLQEQAAGRLPAPQGHLLHGDPGAALVAWLGSMHPALAVLGTHGRGGLGRFLLGSVADHLIRHAPCPLLIHPAKAPEMPSAGPISILADSAAMAGRLLAQAEPLIRLAGHDLEVVLALHPPPGPLPGQMLGDPLVDWAELEALEQARARDELAAAARLAGPGTATHLLIGQVPDTLAEHLRRTRPALAVLGTHGRKGIERALLGSVADHLIRHAPCPMLLVPVHARSDEAG